MNTKNVTRLFCTTVYVYKDGGAQWLMLNHRKLGKWLPPGGKVDPNELPDDCAVRETLEETGLKVRLVGERTPVAGGLIKPLGMQLNVVKPGELEHIDFIYLAEVLGNTEPVQNERESEGIRWISTQEALSPEFNTFQTVRDWIRLFAPQIEARPNNPTQASI